MHHATLPPHHDVVVVGAGPAGLVTAVTLARNGVDVLVLEQRAERSLLPRAVGVSIRQMEVFRAWGLEDALRAGADEVDLALLRTHTIATAAEGIRLPINVPDEAQSAVVSPTTSARVPQDHLERVLADHLAELTGRAVVRRTEVVDIRQDEERVTLSLRGANDGVVTASYVVAADGAHSRTRERLGIASEGPDRLMRGVSAEFRAPLWPELGAYRYALYSITRPDAAGVLIPAGDGARWQYGVVLGPDDDLDAVSHPAALTERIRRASGVPDLPVYLVRQSSFVAGAKLALRFSSGRVFLAGDAAHRVTPRGGTGLTMAVRDGVGIGWRLAWVLRGWAPAAFLATYEAELRPLAAAEVARAADPDGHCHAVVTELHHDLGGRLTHAWTEPRTPGGAPVSTLDLVSGDGLTLMVGDGAARWKEAAARLVGRPPVSVVGVPSPTGHALGLREPGSAVLVRPDAVPVARWYRAPACDAATELGRVVDEVVKGPTAVLRGAA